MLQVPVLGYLLKASPGTALPRIEQVLERVRPSYRPRGEFFPNLGYIEASPVLDSLAAKQVEDGTPLAADAAEYLGRYGSAAMKPVMWEQLSHWHKEYVESGAKQRMGSPTYAQANPSQFSSDWSLYNLDSKLVKGYANAQGWTLSSEDVDRLSKLIGNEKSKEIACTFSCGSSANVGSSPGNYIIYGRANDPVFPPEDRPDYLIATEPFHYSVNQYRCADLKALDE